MGLSDVLRRIFFFPERLFLGKRNGGEAGRVALV